jgi:hypothetical protein
MTHAHNPFDDENTVVNDNTQVDQLVGDEQINDVDTNDYDADTDFAGAPEDDEQDVVPADATPQAKGDKPAKEKKESTRPPVPEGYISPVDFAKRLTEHLRKDHPELGVRLAGDKVIAPQVVYSYIKNNPSEGKFPFPQYKGEDVGAPGRAVVVKETEGLEWWDTKDLRVKNQKAAKAQKEADKAAKAQTSPQAAAETGEVSTGQVVEAE